MLLGKRLPPYGQNAERAKAWGMACMRPSERSLSHDIAQERAVKMAEELLLPPPHAQEDFPCARECRCSMRLPLAAWDAPRHQTCREGAGTETVTAFWAVGVSGYIRVRRARGASGRRARRVLRAFLDLSSVIPNS